MTSKRSRGRCVRASARLALCLVLAAAIPLASAATKAVDLDGKSSNGAESRCDLNVLSSFPVRIENVVTNKAVGEAFEFRWPSAGPGGFVANAAAGTTAGVGAKWNWSTNQSVFSFTGSTCPKDACFLKTSGPEPLGGTCLAVCADTGTRVSLARGSTARTVVLSWDGGEPSFKVYRAGIPRDISDPSNLLSETTARTFTDGSAVGEILYYLVAGSTCLQNKSCTSDAECGTGPGSCFSRGPFSVPGRSLVSNDVTVSSASLTSSLITFFSPPVEVFRAGSTAQPGGVLETQVNNSSEPITIQTEGFPPGCCPLEPLGPNQLNCEGTCVAYLEDEFNCGGCGNVCGEGTCCSNGHCVSACEEGLTFCDGACVDTQTDRDNCGACGQLCPEGSCCSEGACTPLCGEGETPCDGECRNLATDEQNCGACGNVCEAGTCCRDGSCGSPCDDGRALCGDTCHDLQNDRDNCGACGNVCYWNDVCTEGECVRCPEGMNVCGNRCVDLFSDPYHCNSCGNDCNKACPEGQRGVCGHFEGVCVCEEGTPEPPLPPNTPAPSDPLCDLAPPIGSPALAECPDSPPAEPGECPYLGLPAPEVPEAPICTVPPATRTIPPGGTQTTCRPGGLVFREVPTTIRVCGDGIPGPTGECADGVTNVASGTYMRFEAASEIEVGDAYVTPYAVHVLNDPSRDGLIQPGETVNLLVEVLNAGPVPILEAEATLIANPVDLTDDGVANPVTVEVLNGSSDYGTIAATEPTPNCEPPTLVPATNQIAFTIRPPLTHPGDTATPLTLRFTGTVAGAPFEMDMPFALGVADWCTFIEGAGGFDTIDGLRAPMERLVPAGDAVRVPEIKFQAGQPRPLAVRLFCGRYVLKVNDVDAPRIVHLEEATRGEIDLGTVDLNESPDSQALSFTWNPTAELWTFNLRTSDLGKGVFTLTIRLGERKDYVTGFELR